MLLTAEELQVGSYDMNGGQYEAHFDFQNPDHMLERHGKTVGLQPPELVYTMQNSHTVTTVLLT